MSASGLAAAAGVLEHRHVELAVREKRRGVALLDAELDLPVLFAGPDVDAVQLALFGDDVNGVTDKDRRAGGGRDVRSPKLDLFALDDDRVGVRRLHVRNPQADHLTRLIRCPVNRGGDVVVVNDDRGVDAGLEERHLPNRFSGAGVGADHAAVTGGRVKNSLAVKPAECRRGEATVLGPPSRLGRPDEFAGFFVEAVKAIPRRALCPPVGHDAASDHQVAINDWRGGAAVRERHPAQRLHQRMLPEHLAVLCERGEESLRALVKQVAGLGIDRRARGGVARVDDVAQKIVELALPKFLARVGVKTKHALLQIRAFAEMADDKNPAVGHRRRGAPGQIRRPKRVLG